MIGQLEAQVSAAGLAGLPGMTPVRLAKLLDGFHPVLAWRAVQAGAHPCRSSTEVHGTVPGN